MFLVMFIQNITFTGNEDYMNQRFSYDIQKMIPHLRNTKVLCNMGCEEGGHLKVLNQILNLNKIYITDVDPMKVFKVLMDTPLNFEGYHYDFNVETPPEVWHSDTILCLNIFNTLVKARTKQLLDQLLNKTVIIKESVEDSWILNELQSRFEVVKYEALYPKIIEVEGLKTYLFVARN